MNHRRTELRVKCRVEQLRVSVAQSFDVRLRSEARRIWVSSVVYRLIVIHEDTHSSDAPILAVWLQPYTH